VRAEFIAALFLAAACTSAQPHPGPMFLAEGGRHVATITVLSVHRADEEAQYANVIRPGVEAMQSAPGNISVSILRRPAGDDVELTVIAEWTVQERALHCQRDARCGKLLQTSPTEDFDVLFEALQIDSLPEGPSELPREPPAPSPPRG
jgi:hypothetical protein